jgi:hypothetical protein
VRKSLKYSHLKPFVAYCGIPFGCFVDKPSSTLGYEELLPEFDHTIPVAWGERVFQNTVASCQLCNAIKGPNIFSSVLDAQVFIMKRWLAKGYKVDSSGNGAEPDCWECAVLSYGPYRLLQGPSSRSTGYESYIRDLIVDDELDTVSQLELEFYEFFLDDLEEWFEINLILLSATILELERWLVR